MSDDTEPMAPAEFSTWLDDLRDSNCYVVAYDPDEPTVAVVWSDDEIDVPERVNIADETEATGDSPAVRHRNVEGWTKYEFKPNRSARSTAV